MKREWLARSLWLIGFAFIIANTDARSPGLVTNVWTKTEGGNWDDATGWSLGRLPAADQWVGITNDGPKTIEVDAQTAQNFPQSLSMSHLVVANTNTLFLNHVAATFQVDAGTNVHNGVEVSEGGKLHNIDSDLNIKGWFRVGGGEFFQDGGSIEAIPSTSIFGGAAAFRLNNGVFKTGYLEFISGSAFHQYGGTLSATNSFYVNEFADYHLHGGEINLPSSTIFVVRNWSSFTQDGGTVRATTLAVTGATGEAAYLMDGGECYLDSLTVFAGLAHCNFEHNAGLVAVADTLKISGSARYYPPQGIPGVYILGPNAVLRARSLVMEDSYGFTSFENSGQAVISGDFQVAGKPDYPADFLIYDGTFSCQNFRDDGSVVDIYQTGGALAVGGVFSFTGYYPGVYDGINARPARYDFKGGKLTANRIDLAAEWVIGSSSQSHRISNPGQFSLAGILRVGDAAEQLGRFILSNNATINLGDGHAKLAFAASSGEQWNDAATLFIANWEGSASGGGLDQLRFGNDASGLSARQLQQIVFLNPTGFPAGQYAAQILKDGEIVPVITPQLSIATAPNTLTINWANDRVLQSSPNVEGPYTDVPLANPPYTVDTTSAAQLFLRLRP